MVGMRSDRASARAKDLLAAVYPIPDDAEFRRLRELAIEYVQEAERLETERRGRVAESGSGSVTTASGHASSPTSSRR